MKPKTKSRRTKSGNVWGELADVCRRIHVSLYEKQDRILARRYESRLERALSDLPDNDLAILREEGTALLHELRCEKEQAIEHRKREIQLIKRLQDSVHKSVKSGDYDATMAASILAGRDAGALEVRRMILRDLQHAPREKRDGVTNRSASKRNRSQH